MTVYRNCTMEMFDAKGQWELPCEVRISDGSIAVSYNRGGVPKVYEGPETEPGHFKMTCDSIGGRATLHRFAGDDLLDGWWIEEGYEGMWRVTLEE